MSSILRSWLINSALVYEPKCEWGGGGCGGVSANEYSYARGAHISFRDLTSYLTYDAIPAPQEMGRVGGGSGGGGASRILWHKTSTQIRNNLNGSSWESRWCHLFLHGNLKFPNSSPGWGNPALFCCSFKGTVSRDFYFRFFHESSCSSPLLILILPFHSFCQKFSKILEIRDAQPMWLPSSDKCSDLLAKLSPG